MNVSNYDMFFDLTTNIKRIEIKFKRILESLKKGSDDFRALLSLSNSDKLKYFFKLFISTAGNKTKNTKLNPLILQDSDKFGNFQLCSDIEVSNTRLGEMITSFYLNKDKCPYIQIKDTVFAFDLNQNVFNLPNLPVFKDFITSFSISLKISAELDEISLHIKAKEPDRTAFAGKTLVSFVQSDKNYVIKTLDPIVVIDEQN